MTIFALISFQFLQVSLKVDDVGQAVPESS